jgi:hypothetical protein
VHGGEAHGVHVGESRQGRLTAHAAAEDVTAGRVRQRLKQTVGLGFGQLLYNHSVIS